MSAHAELKHLPSTSAGRGWVTSVELMAKSGVTYRQVDHWTRTGLLTALDDDPTPGSGYSRRFDCHQVTRAAVLRDLLAAGLGLQACRRVIDEVLASGRVGLGPVTLVHHGLGSGITDHHSKEQP